MARKDQRKPILRILLLLSLITSPLFAKPVTVERVKKASNTFLKAENVRVEKQLQALATNEIQKESPKEFAIAGVKEIRSDGKVVAYVTELEPEGFIITAADTDIRPILGYSFRGKFPYEDSKQNALLHLVRADVEARLKALSAGVKEQRASMASNNELWTRYSDTDETLVQTLSSATQWPDPAQYGSDGWIKTQWDQGDPCNKFCPMDPLYPGHRCAVGCTATAAAQIINYWKYPGSAHFWILDSYVSTQWNDSKKKMTEIKIPDDNDIYDFPKFSKLNTVLSTIDYSGDISEIAYLCFAVGIKHHMDYSALGSGAGMSGWAYTHGFDYGSARHPIFSSISWSKYENKIIENIKKGWPVQIGISGKSSTGETVGHSIVVDGYKTTGDHNFHINFGWANLNNTDTWYNPPDFLPTDYSVVDDIVYDICPYQGWNQYGANEKNTFRTIYTAPASDQIKDKWYITALFTTENDWNFSGLVVGTGNKIYASLSPVNLNQGYNPFVWVINQYGVIEETYCLTSEDENVSYPVQNSKGEVFVGTGEGGVYKIDTKNKTTQKIFQDPAGSEFGTPKVDKDDYLYFATFDKLFCLNSNGIQRWLAPFQPGSGKKMYRGLPAIDVIRNNIYVGYYESTTKKSYLACINRQTGTLRYQKEFTDIAYQSRMTGVASIGEDGTVYVGCYTNLYAFTPGLSSFSQKWVRTTNSIMEDAPVVGEDGTLYVAYWQHIDSNWYYRFNALNPANGNDKWSSPIDLPSMGEHDGVSQPYAAANNVVIFSIVRGESGPDTFEMYAYRDEGSYASPLWHKDWGTHSGSDVAFGPGGTLYILPSGFGRTLYAVSDGARGDPDGGGMAFTNNSPPALPSNPYPTDEVNNVGPSVTLSWDCNDPESHALKYSLFVGESGYDMVPVDTNVTSMSYTLSGLKAGTGYAWKIIATDGQAVSEGPTWVFATKMPNPDINADGRVNFKDFALFARHWAEPNWAGPENLDWVGNVDFEDMKTIAENWLKEQAVPSDMVLIPGGTFQMGDSKYEGESDELPVHAVTMDSFYMRKFETTNEQYCQFLNSDYRQGLITVSGGIVYKSGSGASYPYCDTHTSSSYSQIDYSDGVFSVRTKGGRNMSYDPMVCVSWYGAAAYCNWLSQKEGREQCYNLSTWACDFNKKGYRLPTEAEWEYAARGGLSGRRFPWDDTISHSQANYYSSSNYNYDISPTRGFHPLWRDYIEPYTSPVGFFDGTMKYKTDYQWASSATSYQTTTGFNNYGLYDMAGNVWEWCNDWYDENYYTYCKNSCPSPCPNPTGPINGTYRVFRGGGCQINAYNCRMTFRNGGTLDERGPWVGFRVILDFN